MIKLIPFLAVVYSIGCNNSTSDKKNEGTSSPLTSTKQQKIITEQVDQYPIPKIEPLSNTTQSRKSLGKTGYSILLSNDYTIQKKSDSLFSIEIENAEVVGELKFTFYDPARVPDPKIPGSAPQIRSFNDTICKTQCRILYYDSFELSLIQGDILTDYYLIRIQIVTRKADRTKPELHERNRLYGILKSLQKDK